MKKNIFFTILIIIFVTGILLIDRSTRADDLPPIPAGAVRLSSDQNELVTRAWNARAQAQAALDLANAQLDLAVAKVCSQMKRDYREVVINQDGNGGWYVMDAPKPAAAQK